MAAAYSTGSASNPSTLLQAIVTFLVAQGWTQDASASEGSGWRAHLHKSGLYVNFRAGSNESVFTNSIGAGYGLGFYLGTGYSGASAWNAQAGGPTITGTSTITGAGIYFGHAGPYPAYHLFDDGADNVVCVVEYNGGVFGYLMFGPALTQEGHNETMPYFFGTAAAYATTATDASSTMNTGSVSGGMPMAAVDSIIRAGGYVKVPAALYATNNNWIGISSGGTVAQTGSTGRAMCCACINLAAVGSVFSTGGVHALGEYPTWAGFHDYTATTIDGSVHRPSVSSSFPRALFFPPWLNTVNQVNLRRIHLGRPPSIYGSLAVGRGWSSRDIVTVGGLDYMLFPNVAIRKAA